jgi:hypothetical protein
VAGSIARNVRKSEALDKTRRFREFIAVSLEAVSKKLIAIKRIGPMYIPEAGSILRDLTEVAVDFFWVGSYYNEKKEIAEQLSEQFFLSEPRAFLEQSAFGKDAMKNDLFLGKFFDAEAWDKKEKEAKQVLSKRSLGKEWREISGVISEAETRWKQRCARAASLVEIAANLKFAPYHSNLKVLSGYTHWDSVQTQTWGDEFAQALFDRDLNVAIGFTHDVINGACHFSKLPIPEKVRTLRHRFHYMST